MEYTIGNATLTTDHSASSHNIPVLLIDGQVYGPEDLLDDGFSAGSVMVTCDAITMQRPDRDMAEALIKWLRQSSINGKRWEWMVRAAIDAEPSEFGDERAGYNG